MPQHFRIHEGTQPHFITSTIVYWIPVFCREDYFKILVDSLAYCARNKGLHICAYMIMPNHLHLICYQEEGLVSAVIGDMRNSRPSALFKSWKRMVELTWLTAMRRASGPGAGATMWNESFHPEQIYSHDFMVQKTDYVHNNPVRAGYVSEICEWKYSSARFYYRDEESIIPVTRIEW